MFDKRRECLSSFRFGASALVQRGGAGGRLSNLRTRVPSLSVLSGLENGPRLGLSALGGLEWYPRYLGAVVPREGVTLSLSLSLSAGTDKSPVREWGFSATGAEVAECPGSIWALCHSACWPSLSTRGPKWSCLLVLEKLNRAKDASLRNAWAARPLSRPLYTVCLKQSEWSRLLVLLPNYLMTRCR